MQKKQNSKDFEQMLVVRKMTAILSYGSSPTLMYFVAHDETSIVLLLLLYTYTYFILLK